MNKVITIIFLGMSFGCSSISEEYKIANTLLGDEKYLSKKADLIMTSNAEIDNFFELDKYLSELGNPNKLYSEFDLPPCARGILNNLRNLSTDDIAAGSPAKLRILMTNIAEDTGMPITISTTTINPQSQPCN